MSELYEQYKDRLRRGHVAVLRGRLDVAVVAYDEAARIAPDRALPHAKLGTVLHAMGRPDEALAAFAAALARAATDETALRGRAALFADLGRRTEAADDLVVLAGALDADGRLADAADAARAALELAESRSRRRLAERLADRLRGAGGDAAAIAAIESALGVLGAPDVLGAPGRQAATLTGGAAVAPAGDQAASAAVEPEAPTPDVGLLAAEADAAIAEADGPLARVRLIELTRAYRASGRSDAAFDAIIQLLALVPADPELHLLLAEMQFDRGWSAVAVEKLRLLARLADLSGDAQAAERARRLAVARAAEDARFGATAG
jgi:tetratricopeptide (TPR) repeat protein